MIVNNQETCFLDLAGVLVYKSLFAVLIEIEGPILIPSTISQLQGHVMRASGPSGARGKGKWGKCVEWGKWVKWAKSNRSNGQSGSSRGASGSNGASGASGSSRSNGAYGASGGKWAKWPRTLTLSIIPMRKTLRVSLVQVHFREKYLGSP